MSLKTSHLFVVIASIIACCAYGMWSLVSYFREGDTTGLIIAVPLLAAGLALLMHGIIFYKHTEDEPWL